MNQDGKKLLAEIIPLMFAFASSMILAIGMNNIDDVWAPLPYLTAAMLFIYSWTAVRGAAPTTKAPGAAEDTGDLFVSIVVPVYNEEPALLLRNLESIAAQSRLPDRVWVIDDGSIVEECAQISRDWATKQEQRQSIDVKLIIKADNAGKRAAIVEAFGADLDADVFFTVDSDTVLDSHAIAEGIKPFGNPEVYGVAGALFGHNRNQNLLTRVVEMEFVSGFLVNRAAMSRLGAVLVTCGSLAAYRADICRDHIDDLLNENFMGARVLNGDDRKLTQFALKRGQVILQESCTGKVALPESLGHLVRQRVRWSTSFFRGTIYMLKNASPSRLHFWLSLLHAGEFVAQIVVVFCAVLYGATIGWWNLALITTAILIPGIVVQHRRYWNSSGVNRAAAGLLEYFSLSLLSTLLSLFVLVPTRFYAILHIRSRDWQTRQKVEAVTLHQDP